MNATRRVITNLLGVSDLAPLSKNDFLPKALKIFFVRQPIVITIAFFSIMIFESPETPELIQWLFVVVGLIAALCFLIPYFTLLYKRLRGSALPFPQLIFFVIFLTYLLVPSLGNTLWGETIRWIVFGGGVYFILFLLPNRALKL